MTKEKPDKGRRGVLGVAVSAIVAGVVAGVGGWFAGQSTAPVSPSAVTVTETVEKTVTSPTVTETVTEPAKTTVPPRTIKFGTTIKATGYLAPAASFSEEEYKTWAKMVNERGGIYVKEYGLRLPVEFVTYDDKSDVASCEKYAERLCTVDNIDIFIGPFATPFSLTASVVADKYQIPYIDACGSSPTIYQRGLKYLVGCQTLVPRWMDDYLDLLKAEGKVKKIALIYADETFGIESAEGAREKAKENGIEVVVDTVVPMSATDFTAEIAKLQLANPDVVTVITNNATIHGGIYKQSREVGFKPKEWHANPVEMWVAGAGTEATEGITADVYYTTTLPFNGIYDRAFWHELASRINLNWVMAAMIFGLQGAACEIAVKAIETAGTLDKAKINEVLHWQWVMTTSGVNHILTDPPGAGTGPMHPIQIQSGEWKILWPPEMKEANHIYPST